MTVPKNKQVACINYYLVVPYQTVNSYWCYINSLRHYVTIEDWPQEGAEEDDDGASASSLSEVAQVDDVGGPQGRKCTTGGIF